MPAAACALFHAAAASLLEAKAGDAVEAVAAALALATSTTEVPPSRSLLTNIDGYATLHATRGGWRLPGSLAALNR